MSGRKRTAAEAIVWSVLVLIFLVVRAPAFDFFSVIGEYDHGYQTALGQQVFHGAVPGYDYFTQYGPAIGWLAATSWATGHVWLAEVLCWCLFMTAGYALLWCWLDQPVGFWWKAVVLGPAVCLVPTYPKYYFVFFPALFLVLLGDGTAEDPGRSKSRRWFFAGLAAGIAGLFRIELGVALVAAGTIYLGWPDAPTRRFSRAPALLWGGALLVVAGYFALLIYTAREWAAPARFLEFQIFAIFAKTAAFSENTLSLGRLTQPENVGGWLLLSIICVYLCIAWLRMRSNWRAKFRPRVWAAALVGGALLPQAFHLMDPIHVRQVALPACACLAAIFLQRLDPVTRRTRLLALLFAVVGLSLGFSSASMYLGWKDPIGRKLASLYWATSSQKAPAEWMLLAAAMDRVAEPGKSILLPTLDTRLYALVRRPWAGLFPHLVIPLSAGWQERGIEALRERPPALVLLPVAERRLRRPFSYLGKNPLIEAFIHENYEVIDRSVPGWLILGPRPPGGTTIR